MSEYIEYIEESFLAFKWTSYGNVGPFQSDFKYTDYQDGKWHVDPKCKPSWSDRILEPALCSLGWHAVGLSQLGMVGSFVDYLWLCEFFGKVRWGSSKFAATEMRWIGKMTPTEVEQLRSPGPRTMDDGILMMMRMRVEGLMLWSSSGVGPQLIRVPPAAGKS